MQDLNDLYYFVQVVDHGGFAAAGRVLGVPKSKLSRRISALERRLGVRLLQRSTRRFSVTDVGRTYYAHCKAMVVEAEAAQEAIDVTHAEPCGIVRMSCPIALLHALVGGWLAEFMRRHPRVEVHLDATNRRVDVVGEGIDLALRVRPGPLEASELVMRPLGERAQCLVASPSLFASVAIPRVPDELTRFPSLDLGPAQNEHAWALHGPDGARATIRHTPRLVTSDMTTLHAAALAGIGIVQLPHMLVGEALARGTLVHLLPQWAPARELVHAVFASRRGLLPSVRALVDFLAERFAALAAD